MSVFFTVRKPDPRCQHAYLRLTGLDLWERRVYFCEDCRTFMLRPERRNIRLSPKGPVVLERYLRQFSNLYEAANRIGVDRRRIYEWRVGKAPIPDWMSEELGL